MNGPMTVAQFNRAAKALLENSVLSRITVAGEIVKFNRYPSGHCYFQLSDGSASVDGVMFASAASQLRFAPTAGTRVLCQGHAGLYENTGRFQLVVNAMAPDGAGLLAAQRAALVEKLRAEGLLDEDRKRPLPPFPRQVAVVTSLQAAALQDILRTAAQRNPAVPLLICPVPVQGPTAAGEIVAMLARIDKRDDIDVVILARGGGSAEDLAAFDDEALARAVAACAHPVVCAVGHETDVSVCDVVSDVRASTPTGAVALVMGELAQWRGAIADRKEALARELQAQIDALAQRADMARSGLLQAHPSFALERQAQALDYLKKGLREAMDGLLLRLGHNLELTRAKLAQVDPDAPLAQGFVRLEPHGKPTQGQRVALQGRGWRAQATIECVETQGEQP